MLAFSTKSKHYGLFGLVLFVLLIPFSFAYKSHQLSFLSPKLKSYYPLLYWAHSHLILFLISVIALAFGYLGWKEVRFYFKGKELTRKLCQHLTAFCIIALGQLFFARWISPPAWQHPIASLEQGESGYLALASPLHKSTYVEAKRFEFGNFEHSIWGGFPHGLNQDSPLISLLTIAMDLPVIDVESFMRLLQQIFFVLLVLAGFGFYLFLSQSLKVSPTIALLGGTLYTLGNPYASNLFAFHFPIFSGPFLLLPYSLILIWAAIDQRRPFLSVLAGIWVSMNFYILQPHPDSMVHVVVFLCGVITIAGAFQKCSPWFILKLGLALGLGIVGGSSYALGALFEAIRGHEAAVLGHQEKMMFPYGWAWGLKALTITHLSSFYLYLPFVLTGFWSLLRKPLSSNANSWIAVSLAVISFGLLAGGNEGPAEFLLNLFKIHASFIFTSRVLTYYGFSLLLCLCCGLQLYLVAFQERHKIWVQVTNALVVIVTAVTYFQKWPVLSSYFWASVAIVGSFVAFTYAFHRAQLRALFGVFCFSGFVLAQCSLMGWTDPGTRTSEPYIHLRTLLMKARLFPEDKSASEKLLQQRLKKFERDSGLQLSSGDSGEAAGVWEQAALWAGKIDSYYTNRGEPQSFHNGMLYYETLPRYSLIMNNSYAPHSDRFLESYMAGMGEGLMTHNFSQDPDLRMMIVYPPLNALYAYPGYYFDRAGEGYQVPSQFTLKERPLLDPLTRHLFNIGGIEYYTLSPQSLPPDAEKLGLEVLPSPVTPPLAPRFNIVKDLRAYRLAYLADEIHVASASLNNLDSLLPPFKDKSPEVFKEYKRTVDRLQTLLMGLKKKHAIVLESSSRVSSTIGEAGGAYAAGVGNTLQILGISGSKAAFQVHCTQMPCQLVFNHAALKNWVAYEDEKAIPISRANFAFLSTNVTLGDHLIWFEYRPWGRIIGAYLTLLFFGCVLFQLLAYQRLKTARVSAPGDLLSPSDGLLPQPC